MTLEPGQSRRQQYHSPAVDGHGTSTIHLPGQPHLLPNQTVSEESLQFERDFGMADFSHWREVNPFEQSFGPSPLDGLHHAQPWPNPSRASHQHLQPPTHHAHTAPQLSKGLVATLDVGPSNGQGSDGLSHWLMETAESQPADVRTRVSLASASFAPEQQLEYYNTPLDHSQLPPPAPPPLLGSNSDDSSTHQHSSSSSSSLPLANGKGQSVSPPNQTPLAQPPHLHPQAPLHQSAPVSIAPSAVFLPASSHPYSQPHLQQIAPPPPHMHSHSHSASYAHPPSQAFANMSLQPSLSISASLPPPPPLPITPLIAMKRPRATEEAIAVPPIKKRGRPPKKPLAFKAEDGEEQAELDDDDPESKLSSLERNRLAAQRSRVRKKQVSHLRSLLVLVSALNSDFPSLHHLTGCLAQRADQLEREAIAFDSG